VKQRSLGTEVPVPQWDPEAKPGGNILSLGQGSFPAGTPGNGVPKVIFTVGTVFPGSDILVLKIYSVLVLV